MAAITPKSKVKSLKNSIPKKESHSLLPAAAPRNTKPKARNNSQPARRKPAPPRPPSTPRSDVAAAAQAPAAVQLVAVTLTATRKKFFRNCLYTWRKLRRNLRPAVRRRLAVRRRPVAHRRARFVLRFRVLRRKLPGSTFSARLKTLTFLRRNPVQFPKLRTARLRRQFGSRASRLSRYTFRPDTRKVNRLAVMKRLSRSIRRPSNWHIRRARRLNRLFLSLPPTSRTRRLLRGVIGTFAARVRSVLPASRARKLRARLGVDLRSRLYSVRRTRTRAQYDTLYSKLAARGGAELRRSLIRRLRANRRNAKAPVRARRKRHSRPIAARIALLQRANLRVRRVVQRQYSPVALGPASRGTKLWVPKLRVGRKHTRRVWRGLTRYAPLKRWRRLSSPTLRSSAVYQYLRSKKFVRTAVGFALGLRSLRRLLLVGNFSAKQGLRRLLLAYRRLQRRQRVARAVLEPVNYFPYTPTPADVRFAATVLSRSLRRRRRRARVYTRARRLRFVREGEGSMLFARLQPYYHSRVLGTKYDRRGSGRSLRALDAAIALQQEAFAEGQQLTKVSIKTSVSRQSLRVPESKKVRLRTLFHLYTGARLSWIGFKRSPQLNRERRTLTVYTRRHASALHRARPFVYRQTYHQQQCRQLARRGLPAGALKLVAAMKLRRKVRLQLTRRWRRLKAIVRSAALRGSYVCDSASIGSVRKSKWLRRWRNPRFKGKWRNFRRPAWLFVPRKQPKRKIRIKLSNVVPLLPTLPVASSRFAWLLTKKIESGLQRPFGRPAKVAVVRNVPTPKKKVNFTVTGGAPAPAWGEENLRTVAASKATPGRKTPSVPEIFSSVFRPNTARSGATPSLNSRKGK